MGWKWEWSCAGFRADHLITHTHTRTRTRLGSLRFLQLTEIELNRFESRQLKQRAANAYFVVRTYGGNVTAVERVLVVVVVVVVISSSILLLYSILLLHIVPYA
jgi:hypothetical protein